MPKAKTVQLQHIRTELPELLERVVHHGERFLVTRNNKPRAALVSVEDLELLEAGPKPAKRRPK